MISKRPVSADVHPGPGFRVHVNYPEVDRAVIDRLMEFEVPDISDQLNRLYALDSGITCLNKHQARIGGVVCTVRVFPGDNLMVHKALDVCRPGDVIVVDAHGNQAMNAVLGDTICAKAQHRGIAGFIVDGLVRDMPGIDELGVAVFGRGTTAVGPLHRGPGEINFPIACGGVVVNPGDVIVADCCGVVAVPLDFINEVLERLEQNRDGQARYMDAVRRGEFSNEWVDTLLSSHNCPIRSEG